MEASHGKISDVHAILLLVIGLIIGVFFGLTREYYPVLPEEEYQLWVFLAAVSSALIATSILSNWTTADRSSPRVVFRYLVYAFATAYLIWSGLIPTLNGFFDTSPGIEQRASILSQVSNRYGRLKTERVLVRLDENSNDKIKLLENYPRDINLYRKTKRGPVPVTIVEKPGFLGLRWIASYRYR